MDNDYVVTDEGSAQGVFVELGTDRSAVVTPRMLFRAGRQWLRVDAINGESLLVHYGTRGEQLGSYPLTDASTIVGRQSPNVTIAPTDSALSRRHFAVSRSGRNFKLKDLGSSNGTFVKVDAPFTLGPGDRIHVGQQVLQFVDQAMVDEPSAAVVVDTSIGQPKPTKRDTQPAPAAAASPEKGGGKQPVAAATGPSVSFDGLNRLVPCSKGQTICEAAEGAGIKIQADCHQGSCGMDPVRVLSGIDQLNPVGGKERDTLEDLCSLDPKTHRLACMARVSGPVTVQIVKPS